jgi:hypothetical protein
VCEVRESKYKYTGAVVASLSHGFLHHLLRTSGSCPQYCDLNAQLLLKTAEALRIPPPAFAADTAAADTIAANIMHLMKGGIRRLLDQQGVASDSMTSVASATSVLCGCCQLLLYFGTGNSRVMDLFAAEKYTTSSTGVHAEQEGGCAEQEGNIPTGAEAAETGLLTACVCGLAVCGRLSEGRKLLTHPQLRPAVLLQSPSLLTRLFSLSTKAARKLLALLQQQVRQQLQGGHATSNDRAPMPEAILCANDNELLPLFTLPPTVTVSIVDSVDVLVSATASLRAHLAACPVAAMDCEWQPSKRRATAAAARFDAHQVPVSLVQVAVAGAVYVLDVQTLVALASDIPSDARSGAHSDARSPTRRSVLALIDSFFQALLEPHPVPKCIVGFAAAGDFKKIYTTIMHTIGELHVGDEGGVVDRHAPYNSHFLSFRAEFELLELQQVKGARAMSLSSACLRHLRVRLDKAAQQSEWARRPLTQAQIKYAALDAHVLLPLACATLTGGGGNAGIAIGKGGGGERTTDASVRLIRMDSASHLQEKLITMRSLARAGPILQTTAESIANPLIENRHLVGTLRARMMSSASTPAMQAPLANADMMAALEGKGMSPTCFSVSQKSWLCAEHLWQRTAQHVKTIVMVAVEVAQCPPGSTGTIHAADDDFPCSTHPQLPIAAVCVCVLRPSRRVDLDLCALALAAGTDPSVTAESIASPSELPPRRRYKVRVALEDELIPLAGYPRHSVGPVGLRTEPLMIQIDEELMALDGLLCGYGGPDLVFCAKPGVMVALLGARVARISCPSTIPRRPALVR